MKRFLVSEIKFIAVGALVCALFAGCSSIVLEDSCAKVKLPGFEEVKMCSGENKDEKI